MYKVLLFLLGLMPALAVAQGAPKNVQEAALGSLMFNESQAVALAEAMPDDKYSWRPAEGVRSVSEVFMHMAGANYFIVMSAGHTPPEGVDPMTLEQNVTSKADVIAALKKSYEYARTGIAGMSDEKLQEVIEFPFPGEYNGISALMIVTGHGNEHLGQLVAYARMNGITPPWSEGGN